MLHGAFLHLPGIGPIRAARLRQLGLADWRDLGLRAPPGLRLGTAAWDAILAAVARCDEAFAAGDIAFFAHALCGPDLWRILAQYGERAAFVDIETEGLYHGARITVIACQWKGRIYTFVQNENLDEFLDLVQNVDLMVTFNGACFDVPMILHCYHIPELPCAHVDLRRVCYHAGCRGGLKAVEAGLGLQRPPDLRGVDGAEAVALWVRWQRQGDRDDRDLLVRYCAADAMALRGVMAAILRRCGVPGPALDAASVWADLDQVAPPPAVPRPSAELPTGAPAPPPAGEPSPGRPSAPLGGLGAGSAPGPDRDGSRPAPGKTSAAFNLPPPRGPGEPPPTSPETAARRRLREMLRRRFARPS